MLPLKHQQIVGHGTQLGDSKFPHYASLLYSGISEVETPRDFLRILLEYSGSLHDAEKFGEPSRLRKVPFALVFICSRISLRTPSHELLLFEKILKFLSLHTFYQKAGKHMEVMVVLPFFPLSHFDMRV